VADRAGSSGRERTERARQLIREGTLLLLLTGSVSGLYFLRHCSNCLDGLPKRLNCAAEVLQYVEVNATFEQKETEHQMMTPS
jgi:hypothetical protein